MSTKKLKKEINVLLSKSLPEMLAGIANLDPRKAVSPLISFFYHPEPLIKWRSITAMGEVVSRLAEEDMEAARVIMRRLMWQLNDESGGIGWGVPEAMGEIMARHERLAEEYHRILISYILPEGNYLEHPVLQRGVLWGIARLAQVRPHLMKEALEPLEAFLQDEDPFKSAMAAFAMGLINPRGKSFILNKNPNTDAAIEVYWDGRLQSCTVAELADRLKE